MEIWQLSLIIGTLMATLISFIWVAVRLGSVRSAPEAPKNAAAASVGQAVGDAFTEEFREELRQRARQQFEKLMHDNAMFLQQDIRVSAAQLDDFMKKEIFATLQQELAKHHETVTQTRQMLSESVAKSQTDLQRQLEQEKQQRIKQLDEHLADIVKKYVTAAVGATLSTDQEVALVIDNLNAHKAEIIEDIRRDG